jgi:hypothetical protein
VVITDAKKLIGKICAIEWFARNGVSQRAVTKVHDVTYVPMYGGYLITDTEDVRLDRISRVQYVGENGSTTMEFDSAPLEHAQPERIRGRFFERSCLLVGRR